MKMVIQCHDYNSEKDKRAKGNNDTAKAMAGENEEKG